MKKIWLLLLSLFGILFIWVSFANPIAPTIYCHTFKNVGIDNYKVIIEHGNEIYEPKAKECTKCSNSLNIILSKVYLLDKGIDIWDITNENIQNKAIFLWEINDFECSNSYYDKVKTYIITKSWNSYKLELSKTTNDKVKRKIKNNLKVFPYAWLVTIIIETICILLIAKSNRKENEISNKKLILSWIIPTTITLPLLWFGLSLLEFWASEWEKLMIAILLSYFIWELLVIIIESCIIKYYLKISRWKAIKASLLCNIVSLILWMLILKWLDWLVF